MSEEVISFTISDITVDHSDFTSADLLQAWSWLVPEQLELLFITIFGDAFLVDPESGEVFFSQRSFFISTTVMRGRRGRGMARTRMAASVRSAIRGVADVKMSVAPCDAARWRATVRASKSG